MDKEDVTHIYNGMLLSHKKNEPWSRKGQPTPVFLPGKFCGQRSLVGYSPRSCKELDMTSHSHRKNNEINEIMPFAAKWMSLIMLCEVRMTFNTVIHF